jgi:dihydropteroate synthase
MLFRARHFTFTFPRPTLVMGIVNVTPDSFSDGGQFQSPDRAIAHALQLVAQGADILDIGGESTRPGATPVSEAEELRRVLPVIEALAAQVKLPLSIDTMKPAVAQAALAAGASIVNDVAANRTDDVMARWVAASGAGYICMHMQGTPRTMQAQPTYTDVVAEVCEFFQTRLARLMAAGLAAEQIIFDPGIGFGKNLEHNLQLLANVRAFTKLGRPLLLGVSRKSFLGQLADAPEAARLPGSLAAAAFAIAEGVQLVRVHDVAETVQALRVTAALRARKST